MTPSIRLTLPTSSRRRVARLLLPILAVAILPGVARARDVGGWKSLGPLGSNGPVSSVVVDPVSGAVYVAGFTGILKSTDRGLTWMDASSGLTWDAIQSLVLDPTSPSVLYAGSWGGGIFKSIDAGSSWTRLPAGPTNAQVLAVAPLTPSTLYAGTDGEGVFKTTDGGSTWTPMIGLTVHTVYTIAVDPRASGTVYVGGEQDYRSPTGLAKTTDGGSTWIPVNLGSGSVLALAINPSSPSTIYLTQQTESAAKLLRTTDGGKSWLSIADSLPPFSQPTVLAIDPRNPLTVYLAGGRTLWRSLDGGLTWSPATAGLTSQVDDGVPSYVYALAIDPQLPSSLYAGTGGHGVFKSIDAGTTWNRLSGVFSNVSITAIATDPSAPRTIYAAARPGNADWGIFKSIDGGVSWNVGLPSPNPNLYVNSILIDPSAPSTVYLATAASGILKSSDGGLSWAEANSGIAATEYGRYVYSLALDHSVPATLYAAADTGVYRSTDAAGTWSLTGSGFGASIVAIAPSTPPTLYAASGTRLFQSLDGGQNWLALNTGLTGVITAIAVDSSSPSTVTVGARGIIWTLPPPGPVTVDGVARTTDGGKNWKFANGGLTSLQIRTVVADPRTPGRLFAATDTGVFASTNSGDGWFSIGDGLSGPTGPTVEALAVDYALPASLYAGTSGAGVYRRSAAITSPPCVSDPTTLCLNGGRFKVQVSWFAYTNPHFGGGRAVPLTGDTGAFWFFTPNNLELVVKVVDGRPSNGRFWFFAGALTDVNYTLIVTDTLTGVAKTYFHPQGPPASIGDTTAF